MSSGTAVLTWKFSKDFFPERAQVYVCFFLDYFNKAACNYSSLWMLASEKSGGSSVTDFSGLQPPRAAGLLLIAWLICLWTLWRVQKTQISAWILSINEAWKLKGSRNIWFSAFSSVCWVIQVLRRDKSRKQDLAMLSRISYQNFMIDCCTLNLGREVWDFKFTSVWLGCEKTWHKSCYCKWRIDL